jgi:hypothetical protein
MGIGLGKKFYTAGFGKLAESMYYLRSILLKLFQGSTGDRKTDLKCSSIFPDQIQHHFIGRQIGFLSDPLDDLTVLVVIIIVMIISNIKKPVGP